MNTTIDHILFKTFILHIRLVAYFESPYSFNNISLYLIPTCQTLVSVPGYKSNHNVGDRVPVFKMPESPLDLK